MATSIFSIIDGLTVESEDIIEAELFAEQYLSAQFPTYDFRQGTALRDMTVRPNATLLALVNKAIKYYFDETDIVNITNSTDNDIADSRLSNFFITRKSGDSAVVKARLYFSFPTVTPIATIIPSSATFSVDNEIQFSPAGNISVNPDPGVLLREDGQYYFFYDGAEDLHYVEVDLVALSPSEESNLEDGDLLYFTIFSPYFLQGNIQYLVSTAIETETNEEMVGRAYSSISTRNLINTPSIEAGITDQFNYVRSVYPVGLGNDDLYRDLISLAIVDPGPTEGDIVVHHKGGHVDVYCDTTTVTQRVQFTLDVDSKFYVAGPVLSMVRSTEAQSGLEEDTVPPNADYRYSPDNVSTYTSLGVPDTPADDKGLSAIQQLVVEVDFASPGETITMDLLSFAGLNAVQTAITSDEQKVVCADYLVRAFEPVFINVTVDVREGTIVTEGITAIEDYILSIPAGGQLFMSSIISAIQNAGVTKFTMPIDVEAITKNRYREFDSTNPAIVDEISEIVVDSYDLRTNQIFSVGTITLTEV